MVTRAIALAGALTFTLAIPSPLAAAQDDTAPERDVVSVENRAGYVEAVQKIATGHEREGLETLAKILVAHPDDPDRFMLHFNAACGRARLGEKEPAFAELEKAVAGGYGLNGLRIQNLLQDPDLESLRGDPRYPALLERAKAQLDDLRARWDEITSAFVWVPPPLAEPPTPTDPAQPNSPPPPPAPLPLLVVLHPYGADREAFARERFLPFCEAHRFALVAPSGDTLIAPGRIAWASSAGEFVDGFRADQRRVYHDVDELSKKTAIDPQRIYVTGVGQGASLGFAIAIRNPQWVRGAVLFGGGYAPSTLGEWLERTAAAGRRIALVHGKDDSRQPIAALPAFVGGLAEKGLAIELTEIAAGHDFSASEIAGQLEARLRWIDAAPFEKPGAKAPAPGR